MVIKTKAEFDAARRHNYAGGVPGTRWMMVLVDGATTLVYEETGSLKIQAEKGIS